MYHLLCSAVSLCPFQLLSPHDQVLKGSLTLPFYGPEKCISFLHYQEPYFFMVSRPMSSWFGKQWSHASGCLWAHKLLVKGPVIPPLGNGAEGCLPTHHLLPGGPREMQGMCAAEPERELEIQTRRSPPCLMAPHHHHWECYWVRWNWKPPFVCWSSSRPAGSPCSQAWPAAVAWALPGNILDDLIWRMSQQIPAEVWCNCHNFHSQR